MSSFSMKEGIFQDEGGAVVKYDFSIGDNKSTEYRVIPVTQFQVVGYGE